MKLAPIDISHKSFKRRAFGLDNEEVSDFLKMVAGEFEDLIRERNRLKEELREKEMELLDYKERDKVLRDTIATAQKMSEKVREDAEREAKIILNDASQKAEMIVRDARDSLKRVYQEVTEIKRAKIQFESNIRALIHSHLNMLESSKDSFMPNLPGFDFATTNLGSSSNSVSTSNSTSTKTQEPTAKTVGPNITTKISPLSV